MKLKLKSSNVTLIVSEYGTSYEDDLIILDDHDQAIPLEENMDIVCSVIIELSRECKQFMDEKRKRDKANVVQ